MPVRKNISVGKRDDRLDEVLLEQVPTDLGLALARTAVEQRRSRKDDCRAAAAAFRCLQLAD